MLFVVSHKNGNVRAIVNADSHEAAYSAFRDARIGEDGVRPKRSNHSVDELTLPIVGGGVEFLKNTKTDLA